MPRCTIQLVLGPAGSGKSTYCNAMQEHCASLGPLRRRKVHVANLDPAAEAFKYDVAFNIQDLISVEEVMDELQLGPNGGLVYCMEYLLDNMDWLETELNQFDDDEYLLLDCPGQMELYTHVPVMKRVIDQMKLWGFESMLSVFVVDATFVCDASKFISGSLLSLSSMIALELPNINVLSKCDLIDPLQVERILDVENATQLWEIEEYNARRVHDMNVTPETDAQRAAKPKPTTREIAAEQRRRKQNRLTEAICGLIDDFHMVSFLPLNITEEDSLDAVLAQCDQTVNYGEDLDVRGADMPDQEVLEDNHMNITGGDD
jgi:GTPase SAR1 family protein